MAIKEVKVGKLTVKVEPDLKGFRNETRRELNRIEKNLPPVKVEVELDKSSLANLKKDIKALGKDVSPVEVGAELSLSKSEMKAFREKIEEGIKPEIDADLDIKKSLLKKVSKEIKDGLEDGAKPSIKVSADASSIDKARREIERELEKKTKLEFKATIDKDSIKEFNETVRVNVDADLKEGSLKAIGNKLSKMKVEAVLSKESLDKIERDARGKGILMDVKFDSGEVVRKLRRITDDQAMTVDVVMDTKAYQDLRKSLAKKVIAQMGVDLNESELKEVRDEVAESIDVAMKPLIEDRLLIREKNKAQAVLGETDLPVVPALDVTAAARERLKVKGIFLDEDIDIKPKLDASSTASTKALLGRSFGSQHVNIEPRLDMTATKNQAKALFEAFSGIGILDTLFGPLENAIRNLGTTTVPVIGAITVALMGLTGVVLSLSADMITLGADILSIGGLLWTLPGILTSVAIGFGLTAVALMDIKKQVPEVVEKFGSLKGLITENFWDGFRQPLIDLVNTHFPALEAGVGKVSTALGQWWGSFATGLSDAFTRTDGLKIMFGRLAESIDIAKAATDNLANIIVNLGLIGTQYLNPLAEAFVRVVTQLDNYIQRNMDNGNIHAWITNATTQLGYLWSALGSVVTIMQNITIAARDAGSATLQGLAAALQRVAEITSTPAFQEGLANVFRAAHEILTQIATISGPAFMTFLKNFETTAITMFPMVGRIIGNVFKTILDTLNDPAVSQGMYLFLVGIDSAVQRVSGSSNVMAEIFGALHAVMGAIAHGAGPLIVTMLQTLHAIIVPLASTIAGMFVVGMDMANQKLQLINSMLPPVINAFNGLLKAIMPLAESTIPAFRAAIETVMRALPGVINEAARFLNALTGWANFISPVLVPVIKFLGTVVMTAFRDILRGARLMVEGFTEVLREIINLVKNVFTGQWNAAWQNVKSIMSGVLKMLGGAFLVWVNVTLLGVLRNGLTKLLFNWRGAWSAMQRVFSAFQSGFKVAVRALWSVVTGLFRGGGSTLKSVWSATFNALKRVFATFQAGLMAAVRTMWSVVSGLFRGGGSALKTVWSTTFNALKTFFATFQSGFRAAVRAMWSVVVSLFRGGGSTLRGIWTSTWNALKTLFSSFRSGFSAGVRTMWSMTTNLFRGGANALKTIWRVTWNALKALFTNWSSSFKTGVSHLWTSTKEAFKAGTRAILETMKTGFRNILKSADDAWRKLVSKAVTGMKDFLRSVKDGWKGIDDFFRSVPGKVSDAVGDLSKVLVGAGTAVMNGFMDGLTDGWNKVKRKMDEYTSKLPDWKGPMSVDKVLLKPSGIAIMGGLEKGLEIGWGSVKSELKGVTREIGAMTIASPSLAMPRGSGLDTAYAGTYNAGNTINYHAYGDPGLPEEGLFDALKRGRALR